jgi:putative membrane protein
MSATSTTSKNSKDRIVVPIIIGLSVLVPLAVALMFAMPDSMKVQFGSFDARSLPFFHAMLNGSTAVLLVMAYLLIKRKKIALHRAAMISAFALSAIFLVSYVVTHISTPDAKFGGEGTIRYVYFFILISHIILSIPVLPLAMFAIYRGWTNDIVKHKKVVRFAFPIWLYVAITGVLVYVFMAPYY